MVFGKGVGFIKPPHEIPLSQIERTFYGLDEGEKIVMSGLPSEVVMFSAKIIDIAAIKLSYRLSPNAVLLLADHINFALERVRKNIHVRMPLAYDIQQMYPVEYELGKCAVEQARKKFRVALAKEEAVGIAMNLMNARAVSDPQPRESFPDMLEDVTKIVEEYFHIKVNRDSFNFSRYATHLQYLFQRIQQKIAIDTENLRMFKDLREEFPSIAQCVEEIAAYIEAAWHCSLSEEEKLYLILHVNRIMATEGIL